MSQISTASQNLAADRRRIAHAAIFRAADQSLRLLDEAERQLQALDPHCADLTPFEDLSVALESLAPALTLAEPASLWEAKVKARAVREATGEPMVELACSLATDIELLNDPAERSEANAPAPERSAPRGFARPAPSRGYAEPAPTPLREAAEAVTPWPAPGPADAASSPAVALWRALCAMRAQLADANARYVRALMSLPADLAPGPRFIGRHLRPEDAAEISDWPAIVGLDPPEYGRLDVRPGPRDLIERFDNALSSLPTSAPDSRTVLNRFFADIAAFGERLAARDAARRAARIDERAAEVAAVGDQLWELKCQALALPCVTADQVALIALERLGSGDDNSDGLAEQGAFRRAILTGLRAAAHPELQAAIDAELAASLEKQIGDALGLT